jgi:putative toxin-antitoxin system antitoxin component (TIGR02293 family)
VNLQNIAEQGLSKTSVNRLIKNSKLPTKYILRYLGISAQALGKKSDTARFSIPVSDRVLDIAQLYVHGINALDTLNNFNQWLNEPLPVLEGRPIELIQSHYGLKIVDKDRVGKNIRKSIGIQKKTIPFPFMYCDQYYADGISCKRYHVLMSVQCNKILIIDSFF